MLEVAVEFGLGRTLEDTAPELLESQKSSEPMQTGHSFIERTSQQFDDRNKLSDSEFHGSIWEQRL